MQPVGMAAELCHGTLRLPKGCETTLHEEAYAAGLRPLAKEPDSSFDALRMNPACGTGNEVVPVARPAASNLVASDALPFRRTVRRAASCADPFADLSPNALDIRALDIVYLMQVEA